ncbi:MAG TPA: SpoIID/LytB domain-containing protein [Pyrinomonadaceae bacterium]|nr:SpoIID/LytB domain-containing protein [Pyrinomonadaceae bacterium]
MLYRLCFSLLALFSIITGSTQTAFAGADFHETTGKFSLVEPLVFRLAAEPNIRIGLATNSRSVSITTSDSQLIAASPEEPNKLLATNRVAVTARAYRPPVIENYTFEIPNIATREEADTLAKDVREATGETATVSADIKTNNWRVIIGGVKETIEEANEYKALLSDKGFEEAEMRTEKITQPSTDAIALSNQLKTNPNPKNEVRSLVKPTGSSKPATPDVVNPGIDPNLREVIVSGASETAKFSSLKPVAFGSFNERSIPVRLNGKAYRGKIEVFVNSRGSLTVVNVVPLEDYLLGVVPNELGLPSIEAQKAQAVAARTYAVANIGQFGTQGFDLLPTIRSQVYSGYSSESRMGTQAVQETRGIVGTHRGKPINALYTSTCGGRTENSENIFDFNEPYLRGVECSLEGRRHFEPTLVKTVRLPARLRDEKNVELVRQMALYALNGFQLSTAQMTDEWFEDAPSESELSNWLNQLAVRFGKTFPSVNKETAKPAELARVLAQMIYGDAYADTLLSEADINYQLSFDDAAEIPKERRADVAILLRDGYFTIHPDLTLKPNKAFSRARMLRLVQQIFDKKKWSIALQTGITQPAENGKLVLRSGKTNRQLTVRPDVFLFRQFGESLYQVRETALVGGETVNFLTNSSGEVTYLEIKPALTTVVAEKMSPFTLWNVNLSPSAVQSRLARYVRGMGALIDVRIAEKGYSRRAVDLEIVTTNGTFHLKRGKIRSALKLREQLFVMNKRYDSTGRAVSYSFTGRGWGHGVGMCQYGAYGLGKMGVKYDAILKHYYTGIDLTKAY